MHCIIYILHIVNLCIYKHIHIYKTISLIIKITLIKNLFSYCFSKVTKLYCIGHNGKRSQKSIWLNSQTPRSVAQIYKMSDNSPAFKTLSNPP